MAQLTLDQNQIDRARSSARRIAEAGSAATRRQDDDVARERTAPPRDRRHARRRHRVLRSHAGRARMPSQVGQGAEGRFRRPVDGRQAGHADRARCRAGPGS